MPRKRYFKAELQWVFGKCRECGDLKSLVTKVPHDREPGRQCAKCLNKHRRLLKEHVA